MADTVRVQQLLKKLEHPKNAYCKQRMPTWFEDSAAYATMMREKYHATQSEKGLRVLYIMNHLCPNLVHLMSKPIPPSPSYVCREPEAMKEYMDLLFKYESENTQASIRRDGETTPGVNHSDEEFDIIESYVKGLVNNNG